MDCGPLEVARSDRRGSVPKRHSRPHGGKGMRLLVVLLAMASLLAGCALPGEESTSTKPPLFGLCPQWREGPGHYAGSLDFNTTGVRSYKILPTNLTDGSFSLDLIRSTVDVQTNGRAQVRAYRLDSNGEPSAQLNILDYRSNPPRSLPVIWFEEDTKEAILDVYLTSVDAKEAPRPGGIAFEWSFNGTSMQGDFASSFHYRVCGAAV